MVKRKEDKLDETVLTVDSGISFNSTAAGLSRKTSRSIFIITLCAARYTIAITWHLLATGNYYRLSGWQHRCSYSKIIVERNLTNNSSSRIDPVREINRCLSHFSRQ